MFLMLFQIYSEKRRQFSLVRNNPRDIVEKVATDIERLLAKKRKALEVIQHTKSQSVFLKDHFGWFWSVFSYRNSRVKQSVFRKIIGGRMGSRSDDFNLTTSWCLRSLMCITQYFLLGLKFNSSHCFCMCESIQINESYIVSTDSLKWTAPLKRFILEWNATVFVFSICDTWCSFSSDIHIYVSLILIRALQTNTHAVSHDFCESVAGGSV